LSYGLGLPHVGGPMDYRTQYSNRENSGKDCQPDIFGACYKGICLDKIHDPSG
jgi:hypothetical protein